MIIHLFIRSPSVKLLVEIADGHAQVQVIYLYKFNAMIQLLEQIPEICQ